MGIAKIPFTHYCLHAPSVFFFVTLFHYCFLTFSCPSLPPPPPSFSLCMLFLFILSPLRDDWNFSSGWESHFKFLFPCSLYFHSYPPTLHAFLSPLFWRSAPVSLASQSCVRAKGRQHSPGTLLTICFFFLFSFPGRLVLKHARRFAPICRDRP